MVPEPCRRVSSRVWLQKTRMNGHCQSRLAGWSRHLRTRLPSDPAQESYECDGGADEHCSDASQLPLSVIFPCHHYHHHSNSSCFYYVSCVAEPYSHSSRLTFRGQVPACQAILNKWEVTNFCKCAWSSSPPSMMMWTSIESLRHLFRIQLHDPSDAHAR